MTNGSIWQMKGRFAGATLFALLAVPATILAFITFVAGNQTFSGLGLTPIVLVHTVLAGAWVLMLAVQAWLARAGNIPLHRTIGRTSYVLAPAVFILMMAVFIENLHRRTYPFIEADLLVDLFNWINPIAFIACWFLAIRNRKNTPRHMRYMVATILAVGSAILARLLLTYFSWIPGITDLNVLIAVQGSLLLAAIGWLIWRDRNTGIKPSPFWLPFASNLLIVIGFYTFGRSDAWSSFMHGFAAIAGV